MQKFYIAFHLINILALIIFCRIIKINANIGNEMRRHFMMTVISAIIVVLAEIGTQVFEVQDPAYRIPHMIANVVGFGLSPFIPALLGFALHGDAYKNASHLLIPAFINAVISALSPFGGYIFVISAQNDYSRGPLFFVYVLSYSVSLILLCYETFRATARYNNRSRSTLIYVLLFILGGTSIQVIWPDIHTTWLCVSLGMLLFYGYFCVLFEEYDVITELLNRRVYERELERLEQADCATVILFDVNDFKLANDTYGHGFGDLCLYELAQALKEAFLPIGTCYRIGGDEFCMLSRVIDPRIMDQALERLLLNLDRKRQDDPRISMLSFGMATYNRSAGVSIDQTVHDADVQLYRYKRKRKAGKNEKKAQP